MKGSGVKARTGQTLATQTLHITTIKIIRRQRGEVFHITWFC